MDEDRIPGFRAKRKMSHQNNIVKKPWGYEYLVYSNEHVGLWFLSINKNQKTSMHCHPNKTTGLMVLDGEVKVSFLSDSFDLKTKNKLMIRKGLFHSTKAISENGASIFEIETPVDKHDLVRLEDSYGREGKPYEDESFEIPKKTECLWIEDPPAGEFKIYHFENSSLKISHIQELEELENISEGKNVMFLRGGILSDYDIHVAGPGDIVSSDVIRKLTNVFQKISIETIILTLEDENEQ